MCNKEETQKAVKALVAHEGQQAQSSIAALLAEGAGRVLVDELLTQLRGAEHNDEVAIQKAMSCLEASANAGLEESFVLMTHLASPADAMQMHDVFDAIGMWLTERAPRHVAAHLRQLVAAESDVGMRRRLMQWSEAIERRAGNMAT